MKTVELIEGAIYTNCKIVKKTHEPIMKLIYGLK